MYQKAVIYSVAIALSQFLSLNSYWIGLDCCSTKNVTLLTFFAATQFSSAFAVFQLLIFAEATNQQLSIATTVIVTS